MKMIDNIQTTLLAKMMDVYALRNKITAANVANIETPGYQRKEVHFEKMLAQELDSGNFSKDTLRQMQPEIKNFDTASGSIATVPIALENLIALDTRFITDRFSFTTSALTKSGCSGIVQMSMCGR